jgi:hypothetical protein
MVGRAPSLFRRLHGAEGTVVPKILLLAGFLLGMTPPAGAMVMRHVFRVDLPVSRLAARLPVADIQRAAGILLDRITGDPDLATRGTVSALIAESGRWVAEYGYERAEAPSGKRAGTSPRLPFRLWIRFAHRAVERAVLGAHLPYWGDLRPRLLIWLDAGSSSGEILSASSSSPLRRHLKRVLARLALPALLPIMDLGERTAIGIPDLFPPAWPLLHQVSRPYHPEALWVGRLRGNATRGWMGSFAVQAGRLTLDWQSVHVHLHRWSVLRSALDYLDSILASRYAVFASHQPVPLSIRIRGRLTLGRVSRIEHFIHHLPGIRQPRLSELASQSLVLTLVSRIDRTHLERLMTLAGPGLSLKPEPGHRLVFVLQS